MNRKEWQPVPLQIPITQNEPPPERYPKKPERDIVDPDQDERQPDDDQNEPNRGTVIISGGSEEKDDREWNPFKGDDEL